MHPALVLTGVARNEHDLDRKTPIDLDDTELEQHVKWFTDFFGGCDVGHQSQAPRPVSTA
jgi:hypothetical protein